ncbi:MAG: Trk system potassium transporter TrkA [Lachnospiraceae bacterium]|nr:Trk system potassium transporter TrkA [Lachnospiraceae bacterium]
MKHSKPENKGLDIIIVGCGKVGAALTEQLCKEGHAITLIDKKPQKMQALEGLYDVLTITGNGASYNVLKEAGIEEADLIIAVTNSDELNLLCCTIATQVGNCAAIARVRTPEYSAEVEYLRGKLGLAMIINPELETAREAARILSLPTALEVNSFAQGKAEMAKFRIPEGSILDGMTIMNLSRKVIMARDKKANIVVCAIERDGEVYIPSGNFEMRAGDLISFVASSKNTRLFMEAIGMKSGSVKNTMIIGGGRAAYYLASCLIAAGIEVRIIENNPARCEELSVLLPKAFIINGDGTNEELLKEEGIEYVESFVPLTGIDEENILLTLYAKQASNAKIITKINRITFKDVISKLDLGSVVYPRYITAEAIIAYVRAKTNSKDSDKIETLYHMFDSRVEAIEFRVENDSAVTNIAFKDLALKKHLLISFINRRGRIIIPTGQDCIHLGDTVMIVTTQTGFHNILDILED